MLFCLIPQFDESKKGQTVMAIKLTKEMVLSAIEKGKVTYNLHGSTIAVAPTLAKEYLLRKIESIENGEQEVDLSIVFGHRPNV